MFLAACQASADRGTPSRRGDVRLASELTTVESLVPRNATLESLLRQENLPDDLTSSVVAAVGGVGYKAG